LWQDPCTVENDIGTLYPENYHFTRGHVEKGGEHGLAHSVKMAVLAYHFGYTDAGRKNSFAAARWVARIAGGLPFIRSRAGRSVRYLKAQRGRLLDVGCGNGAFLQFMKSLGWEVQGIEPDLRAARIALDGGLQVTTTTIEEANLPDGHFDAICLSHVMEHFRAPHLAVERMAKALKMGGAMVSISPNPQGWLRRYFGRNWYALDPPRHLVIPSCEGYRTMCKAVGLQATCRTTMDIAFWVFSESVSIRRTGGTGEALNWIGPRTFSLAAAVLTALAREAGEEVVCYAVKR
jgi:SAM-dependent methyltransferase